MHALNSLVSIVLFVQGSGERRVKTPATDPSRPATLEPGEHGREPDACRAPRSQRSGVLRWPQGAAMTLRGQELLLERHCSPQAGTGSPQVCLCHQNKHLLRANVLQAAKAQLSQIWGGGGWEKSSYQSC